MDQLHLSQQIIDFKLVMNHITFDRSQAPSAKEFPELNFGEHQLIQFPNGMKCILVEDHKLPYVTFQTVFDFPPQPENELSGLSTLVGDMVLRGTATRSKSDIDEAIDYIGARLQSGPNTLLGSVLKKHLQAFIHIYTDVMVNVEMKLTEFEKLKVKMRSQLDSIVDDPSTIASQLASRVMFGPSHPYGEIITPDTLPRISLADCAQYYEQFWSPQLAYMAVVGDITADELMKLLPDYFHEWNVPSGQLTRPSIPSAPKNIQVHIVDRPQAVQTEVRVGYPLSFYPWSEDLVAANVMNNILGGGVFSGYLMSNIREDKGYTYGVRSVLQNDPYCGEFEVRTSVGTEVTIPTLKEILYEMKRIVREKVSDEHLDLTKNSMLGSFARSLEKPQNRANRVLNMLRYKLPDDYYSRYIQLLKSTTSGDVMEAAQHYMHPDQLHIVLVGHAESLKLDLNAWHDDWPIRYYDAFARLQDT